MAASLDSIAELCQDQPSASLWVFPSPVVGAGFLLLVQSSHPGLRQEDGRETSQTLSLLVSRKAQAFKTPS